MKIVAVDPEPRELMRLSECIRKITPPGTSVECFCDPFFARQYAFFNQVDRLYALADMKGIGGMTMSENLRKEQPAVQTYILWEDETFRDSAMKAGASGYIVKPVTADKLLNAEDEEDGDDADE